MATLVQTQFSNTRIRVAVVIEGGKIKPVWFEETNRPARDRVFIKSVDSVWSTMDGAARVINFAVSGEGNCYHLAFNTREFTWRLGIVQSEET